MQVGSGLAIKQSLSFTKTKKYRRPLESPVANGRLLNRFRSPALSAMRYALCALPSFLMILFRIVEISKKAKADLTPFARAMRLAPCSLPESRLSFTYGYLAPELDVVRRSR